MFELVENIPQNAVIKVIGVGGGGGNAVHHMISNQVDGVEEIIENNESNDATFDVLLPMNRFVVLCFLRHFTS